MSFSEDDLLPISALQHLVFCERQWGLIHLEQSWVENRLTAEGRNLHERAHKDESETRGDVRIVRGLPVRSFQHGLAGKIDVVEFHRLTNKEQSTASLQGRPLGTALPGAAGLWRPIPVEYKRGRPKRDHCDEVQVCAQALCLEEMLNVSISQAALFYGTPRRRTDVSLDAKLRDETLAAVCRVRELTQAGLTPPPRYSKKCKSCSLLALCLPEAMERPKSTKAYLLREIDRAVLDQGTPP